MTGAELAILGLIAEKARHGYEIEQVIDARNMRDWTEIGFSSIYYLLKKLEKSGWIRGRLEAESMQGPARKVYELTPEGYSAWSEAVLAALSIPHSQTDPFQIGLSNLPGLPPQAVLTALRSRRDNLRQTLLHVHNRRTASPEPLPPHVDAMFSVSEALLNAEIAWLETYIDQLTNG